MPARTLRLAHRGDWRRAPENSIAAFTAALAIPACDGLEFDVRSSADGVPVVSHDVTLERTHGRPERVDALSAAALEALGIPTLAEVLAMAGRRPFLDVELKEVLGPVVVELLAGARGPGLSNAVVSSFEVAALERVGHLAPAWPRWLNSHTLGTAEIDTAVRLGCRGVAIQWRALDEGSVARAQAAGLEVASYTVRRRATFDRLARLGVVAVCVETAALDGGTT
jgi:glycerophosphoryl diester phosphodiesterase